jgi:DNA-binding MarR family transcriptional regulator
MSVVPELDPAAEVSKALVDFFAGERPPRFLRVANEFELSPPQLNVMRMLEPGVELPMSALAGQLYCDPSNVTGIVDRLEARGLIERRADPEDRRVKRIVITRTGARMRERMLARLYEPPEALERLSASEQRQLARLLRKALGT